MSTVHLKQETLGKTGLKMYKIARYKGYSEDDLFTLMPHTGNIKVDHHWILARWLLVVKGYEAEMGHALHWAFVGTKTFTQTFVWTGSGHVIFPLSSLPKWNTLKRLWKQAAGGTAKHTTHSYDRPVHRSKVGYWAGHFDDHDYVCEFSDSWKELE